MMRRRREPSRGSIATMPLAAVVAVMTLAPPSEPAHAGVRQAGRPATAPPATAAEALRAGRLFEGRRRLEATTADDDPVGRFLLARMLAEGLGGDRDPAAARRVLAPLAARPFRGAKVELAVLLRDGIGGPADPAAAARLLRQARDLGDVRAVAELGLAHARGLGVDRDLPEAFALLVIASLNDDPMAPTYLSELVDVHGITRAQMDEGDGRRAGIVEAIAAAQARPQDTIDARVDLEGFIEQAAARADAAYEAERYPEAFRIHLDLADAVPGRGVSMFYVGRMLERGYGMPADQAAAAHWYTEAVLADVPVAAFNLAWMYEEGRGLPEADQVTASRLFEAAAARGWWDGMVECGLRMLSRRGFDRLDPVRAAALLLIAAEDGDRAPARSLLEQAGQRGDITAEDIELARTLADELRRAAVDGTYPPPPLERMVRTRPDGAHLREPVRRLAGPPPTADAPGPAVVMPPAAGRPDPAPRDGTDAADMIELVPFEVPDPAMNGLVAFRGLMPRGWTREGGVQWTNHLLPFVRPWFALVGPGGRQVSLLGGYSHSYVEATPGILAQMRRAGTPMPEPGQPQLDGTIFMPPPASAAAYVTDHLIRHARPNATGVRPVETRPMPDVAAMLERMMAPTVAESRQRDANLRQFGVGEAPPPRYEATLVVVEYDEDGTRFREEIPMLLMLMQQTLHQGGESTRTSWWTAFPIGALRAPAATFEAERPLLMSLMNGIARGDAWGMRVDAMQQRLQQAQLAARRQDLAERERLFQQTQASFREASDASFESLRAGYESRKQSQDEMQRTFINGIRDLTDYQDPSGGRVTLPSLYDHVYTDGEGRYILTNRVLIDDSGLTKLQPAR